MTQEQANTLVINADENILQGWLDLQRIWFDNRNDPDMMKAGIADWQKRYPNNPGAKMLPTQLVNVKAFKPASTNKIALLLPLNGGQRYLVALFSKALKRRKYRHSASGGSGSCRTCRRRSRTTSAANRGWRCQPGTSLG